MHTGDHGQTIPKVLPEKPPRGVNDASTGRLEIGGKANESLSRIEYTTGHSHDEPPPVVRRLTGSDEPGAQDDNTDGTV